MQEKPRRRWRFSLRLVAIAIAVAVAFLAGVRVGFHSGYQKASAEYGIEDGPSQAYKVADLVVP